MGNWRRTGWLVNRARKGSAHPRRYGCTAQHTPYRSRCRIRAKPSGRRYAFLSSSDFFSLNQATTNPCGRKLKIQQISQVYLHFPVGAGEPPSVLRGFTDVELWPGESRSVNVSLSRYDLSVWDVPSQSWMRALGTYSLSVGASSRDFRLNGTLPLSSYSFGPSFFAWFVVGFFPRKTDLYCGFPSNTVFYLNNHTLHLLYFNLAC